MIDLKQAKRTLALLGGTVLVSAFAVACAAPASTPAAGTTPAAGATPAAAATPGAATTPAAAAKPKVATPANAAELRNLSGTIVMDGSSTVFPVTAAAAEEFRKYAPNVRTTVGISGTGGGFKRFCAGETQIQNASRPISVSEKEECEKNGIQFIELPVAFDGLSVVISPQNDFVDCLTVAELKKVWEPAAERVVTNWNQIRPSFPNRPLRLFGAGADSGTFDYFTEAIVGRAKSSRGDFQASEDDNILVQGVSTDPNALGFFGFAYYVENPGKLKAVKIDNGNGNCVAPSFESIANGSYQPLSRPIFIYVKKGEETKPEVREFVRFYLSPAFTPIIPTPEVGYVPLSDQLYQAITQRFNNAVTGSLFPRGQEVGATLDRYLQAR